MSKPRSVTIRRSDAAIAEAFIMALAQLGVRIMGRHPYITIRGNKEDGVVEVITLGSYAKVYCYGSGNVFFGIDRVVFEVLHKKTLETPITVQISNIDGNNTSMQVLFTHILVNRTAVVFSLLGEFMGYDFAEAIGLWEYPVITTETARIFKLTYEPKTCGIEKIEVWYDLDNGYTWAVINGTERYERSRRGNWTKA